MRLVSQKNIKYLVIVFVLLIVIFASLRAESNPVKGAILTVSSPFLKTFRIFSGGVSGFFEFMGSIGDLKSENEKLLGENQSLLAQNNRLKDAEKENQFLRKELDLAPRSDFTLEASFVIAQDPQGLGNYFLIDKGENSGVKTGMAAIVSNGILVGQVTEVYVNSAKVTLITDPSSAINAEVQSSGAKGIVNGEYGLGLQMDMISQTVVLSEGDTVIASGLGGKIPRGLTIGKIGQIGQSPDKLFQVASVVPAIDVSGLRTVFIIKK
jgi:rod shape-determining protein MreC